ncbi:hypothetical protein O3P69_002835 [Scylla paramamosain]|uniref:Uncharacterized protein n=1 Tax=Scylla paramamosain TaxID=85552 RepID=A0AAW0UQ64_SCYPA
MKAGPLRHSLGTRHEVSNLLSYLDKISYFPTCNLMPTSLPLLVSSRRHGPPSYSGGARRLPRPGRLSDLPVQQRLDERAGKRSTELGGVVGVASGRRAGVDFVAADPRRSLQQQTPPPAAPCPGTLRRGCERWRRE